MAKFKSKLDNPYKNEIVFDGGRHVATIKGTLETDDPKVIADLDRLGYERVAAEDKAPAHKTPAGNILHSSPGVTEPKESGVSQGRKREAR